ncbi:hypothetical protein BD309DRAFT_951719 [Dichomitus squalens]|uniref:Six-hairpin glycosidase-like protein n=1 Tax=Dichomitus squalens TaxID=114155 RepID=A0A4Q9Q0P5_9APHY|nr:hypothetical protein BD311DRAFT_787183 [Dichomitus squalens]TBU47538.1 hypothetical protein BD309DRAFT_951719 [Dichomitus squalens]TBU60589.1 hypothetical protein BD310DRAFT_922754 [Dichomitus squalens]
MRLPQADGVANGPFAMLWGVLISFFASIATRSVVKGGSPTGLAPKAFLNLPLGTVKPAGWLHDQLVVQTNGLAGHEHDFYDYVSDSDWIGGTSYYSYLEEAGSYWFNGMVPNGVLLNDSTIQSQVQQFLDYVLDHQDSTGWLGPEVNTTKPRYLWGRYPFFFGAIQMVEANPALTDRVVSALHKFVSLANTMLHNGEGLEDWARTRWEDFVMTLQWLYDFHPEGKEDLLIDTMKQLKYTGDPWEDVFKEEYFPKIAVENLTNPFPELTWHGVNMAEGLKALPSTYRFTHNQSDLDVASKGWDLLFQYHGRPSGIYAADEYLAGLEAVRGTELCLVVETMFSGSYLYQVIGDPKFADRVERITYNALPAELTGDMWSRQYLQQQNQIAAKNMTPNPFPEDGPYSNVFGLEPNYPCCTVNHPQGWPKFISNAFVATPDQTSLVHVYLGPYSVNTTLANGNNVAVSVDTLYPFSDSLTTTITAAKAFTYYVRIPSWVSQGTISVNGGAARPVSPSNGLHAVSVNAGTTKFTLDLPSDITIEERPHGSVAVHRGPLHYAFDISRSQKVLAQNAQQPLAVDLEFDTTETWQYAIDPSTLVFHGSTPSGGKLPSPVFDSGLPPFTITATACPIDWEVAGDTFAAAPPTNPTCTGAVKNITLWPFGSTKLRISEFPTFKAN